MDAITSEVERLWVGLMANGELSRRARGAGIAATAMLRPRSDLIRVEEVGTGRDRRTRTLTVSVGPSADADSADSLVAVLSDVWRDILVPRLRNRFGADAMQEERPPRPEARHEERPSSP
ncbi:MAG: hypothetical protein ABI969_00130 [bacterium]